jgi:hypothetical protein
MLKSGGVSFRGHGEFAFGRGRQMKELRKKIKVLGGGNPPERH